MTRKQQLLKKHRQKKRLILKILAVCLLTLIVVSFIIPVLAWFIPIFIISVWLGHEAWLADHLFYSPKEDYHYDFPEDTLTLPITLQQNHLHIAAGSLSATMDTLILAVKVESTLCGQLFDPQVIIEMAHIKDRQDFERGANGIRYLNLSGLADNLLQGNIAITTKHCHLIGPLTLYAFKHADYSQQPMMIIAPHADDAELAAFGQYSQCPKVSIITLTQGEIEAEHYQTTLNLSKKDAAQLKGQLRSWDSVAIPLWGGVPTSRSVQLGYYCMQLKAMHKDPQQAFGSKESTETDIRLARVFNDLPLLLPSDNDGLPTWQNLKNDMAALIEHFKPEVIVMPHPQLDPHEDHIQAALLIEEVLQETVWQPKAQLLYANHLYDNDRWPMGPANNGIALPPAVEPLPAYAIWSPILTEQTQINKAMALAMQHDLQPAMPFKKRLRRAIQRILTGRQWPKSGENEFFRKAIRRHELFWVKNNSRP